MFSKGIPPTACPSAAYPRQGSKSLDRGGEFHASPPWVERHAHDQIEVVGSLMIMKVLIDLWLISNLYCETLASWPWFFLFLR